jgi:trk system potassium uptake protein TrkA
MSKHDTRQFAVLGLGRFGYSVAKTLSDNGYQVLGVDRLQETVTDASEFLTHTIIADLTNENSLRAIGLGDYDVVIMAMSRPPEAVILGTLVAKEEGVKYVIARVVCETHAKILLKIGADRVIMPEEEMGKRVATSLITGSIIDSIELSVEYSIIEVKPPSDWCNHLIKELNIRSSHDINVIAVYRDSSVIIAGPDTKVLMGDILVAIGDKASIEKFMRIAGNVK